MPDERDGTLRVVRGGPTAAELAALTAVLSKIQTRSIVNASAAHSPQPTRGAGWPDRAALIGAPPQPGPGAWRRSFGPR